MDTIGSRGATHGTVRVWLSDSRLALALGRFRAARLGAGRRGDWLRLHLDGGSRDLRLRPRRPPTDRPLHRRRASARGDDDAGLVVGADQSGDAADQRASLAAARAGAGGEAGGRGRHPLGRTDAVGYRDRLAVAGVRRAERQLPPAAEPDGGVHPCPARLLDRGTDHVQRPLCEHRPDVGDAQAGHAGRAADPVRRTVEARDRAHRTAWRRLDRAGAEQSRSARPALHRPAGRVGEERARPGRVPDPVAAAARRRYVEHAANAERGERRRDHQARNRDAQLRP